MNNHAAAPAPTKDFGVRDFYLGRQPILDRNNALFGYELLFRNSGSGAAAHITSGLSATAAVIAHAGQLGLDRAIGDAQAFLNVDADVLMSDIFVFLPREKVVLELVDSFSASDAVLERMGHLKGHGFRFALHGGAISAATERMMPLIDFVKFDMAQLANPATQGAVARFRRENKKLVAEKVETRSEYDSARSAGFDYFQGYYFAKPVVMSGRKLTPSQLAVVELMKLVTSEAENVEIERSVKRDVTLALNLLRLVNTPAVGMRHKIDSVSQALIVLGRRQLERWLQILLYADPKQQGHSNSPLLMLATTRGKLLELLAKRLRPSQRNVADIAFTVGIMSLMDTLFGMRMAEILEQIPVIDEVRDALLSRTGFFGDLLKLAESIEASDGEELVTPSLYELAISSDELVEFEVSAFAWSDSVVKYAI